MIPKATEDTITALIAEELKRHGVKVQLFPSINTPKGIRKPDAICVNAGQYIVEAKFHERDLLQAVAKVQNDYLKFYKILGIKGGFALLYPRELAKPMSIGQVRREAYRRKFRLITMFPPEDKRNFSVTEGHIGEIAKVIAEHVLTPPSYVEPSVPYIIETLRQSAQYIVNGLRHLSGQQLEEFFGGKHVFQNILQYEEQKYPLEDLRLAAAYILVNQLLFYHVLSAKRPDIFPQIEPDQLRSPIELKRYFDKVLNVNYKPVFQYDACKLIPRSYLDHVKTIINAINGLSPEKVGGDLLGTIFHDFVPFEIRKSVAAFYTNVLAAELLAWLSIDDPNAKVADFACGSGGLLVAAYRRKKYLTEQLKGKFTYEDHKRFLEKELLGIDVMPFAASVAACHLSLQSPEYFTDKVQIGIWDSTELKPGDVIPTIAGVRYVLRGQVGLEAFEEGQPKIRGVVRLSEAGEEKIRLDKYDIVIMNPPFTRYQRIPRNYKTMLAERLKDYRKFLHGQLGYYGYFIFLADMFTKIGGKIALVLPATTLRVESTKGIRELLVNNYHIEHIITTWARAAFSEGAQFREILLVARKIKGADKDLLPSNLKCVVTVLKKLPRNLGEAREMAEKLKDFMKRGRVGEILESDLLSSRIFSQKILLENTSNLFPLIAFQDLRLLDIWSKIIHRGRNKLIKFRNYLNRVKGEIREGIGAIKGGQYQYFFLLPSEDVAIKKSDVWVVKSIKKDLILAQHRFLGHVIRIPINSTCRGMRRLSGVDKMDVSDNLEYIVIKPFPDLQKFLSVIPGGKPKSFMTTWEKHVTSKLGLLSFVRRFDLSATGSKLLCFYSEIPMAPVGVLWSINIPKDDAPYLALWLNSSVNILQVLRDRKETRGAFMQIDGYTLNNLLILDPNNLLDDEKHEIMQLFKRIKTVKFPDILSQLKENFFARIAIDKVILKTLGFSQEEIDEIIDYLYPALYKEIEKLKRLMEGT